MKIGDVIDQRFRIESVCSTTGGMGTLFHVTDVKNPSGQNVVMKVCKAIDPKLRTRFTREVRLLNEFAGNSRVAQLRYFNTEHTPPYYIMRYYAQGDLTSLSLHTSTDSGKHERVLCEMIDCVNELHVRGVFHRDIKPQNFLVENDSIVVSDLGFSVEIESMTSLTSTSEAWGTFGYAPPEYSTDGFKNPDAAGDIFMLGKSFYVILTGRHPVYMTAAGIAPALFHVIQRACNNDKTRRYATLAELKQAIVSAYDVILNRVNGLNRARSKLATVSSRLTNERQYDTSEIIDFLDALASLDGDGRDTICQLLTPDFFLVISQAGFDGKRDAFLDIWGEMVRRGNYGWPFAETIASCAKVLFEAPDPNGAEKAKVLELSIIAAFSQNRFAAMNTCTALITGIKDNDLAQHVLAFLQNYSHTFVSEIEPVRCENDFIGQTIRNMKVQRP